MIDAIDNADKEANRALLDDFKIQGDVKNHRPSTLLREFSGLRFTQWGFLAAFSKSIYGGARGETKPSRRTLRHHLFKMHIPRELSKSIIESAMGIRKMDLSKDERLNVSLKYIYLRLSIRFAPRRCEYNASYCMKQRPKNDPSILRWGVNFGKVVKLCDEKRQVNNG